MNISWGTIDANGIAVSGGNNVVNMTTGEYRINLGFVPNMTPALVGTQTRSGNTGEANTDGIVFPMLGGSAATVITGDNTGTRQNRSFCYIAAGETTADIAINGRNRVLWGVINSDGTIVAGSGGFTVPPPQAAGQYVINFPNQFSSMPAMVATQTNSGNLTEANTDGTVIPLLSTNSATLITGNNKSTPENRNFSFIAIGDSFSASADVKEPKLEPRYGPYNILWGSVNADGTIAGGSGGFWVSHQGQGMYAISFPSFAQSPAIVGSQTRSGNLSEDNREGMVFPWVNTNFAIAVTGDASGSQQDRSFSFIAFGLPVPTNQE
jgi:hypothetical protein